MSFTWEWIDPDGATTALWVEYDVKSIFAPPAVLTSEVVPGQPGQRLREVRHDAREFTLPLYLFNDDEDPSPLHQQIRDLVYAMDPVRGEGRLRVTTPLGDTREMGCRVVA